MGNVLEVPDIVERNVPHHILLINILRLSGKCKENRKLIFNFMQIIVYQKFNRLWVKYQKDWYDKNYIHIRCLTFLASYEGHGQGTKKGEPISIIFISDQMCVI